MVWFYALRDGMWYYVEMGVYREDLLLQKNDAANCPVTVAHLSIQEPGCICWDRMPGDGSCLGMGEPRSEAKEILLTAATNSESHPGRAKRKAGKTYSPGDRKIQGSS